MANACLASASREDIIRVLFAVWLADFQAADIPEQYRLEKFALVSIDNGEISAYGPDKTPVGFTAVVTYSVQPTVPLSSNPASWWAAGDGFADEAGWVRGKKDAVWITKNGDYYEINVSPYGMA